MTEYRLGERLLAWYLSSITGFIDAIGFIYLGGFFLSFMSGNTTRMTASATEHLWGAAGKAAGLMALFLMGVMLGSVIRRTSERFLTADRSMEIVLGFVVVTSVISAVLVYYDYPSAAILTLSFVVGSMNSVFEKDGEVSISLTYATGTLVKTAQRFIGALFGENHKIWIHHLLLWMSLACGSILGGISYMHLNLNSVWIACGLICLGFIVTIITRQWRRYTGSEL
ncbi:DUF1275 domain-containing protein [Corynebacterium poyangense]|uniref:DUF1275 domain-containing protein n=1 Tax=Corynebacterium poyangense TaxID=2684405 RepID=A0A7H0SPR4_9CORY|nr:YoaK family protein [Corynebacterium poyangense]MBZ8178125.1 DUF1275 domain-containing protein [Corynebacterium poyangense]QNQ90539.1 DUF1275 domain-containing protein [Corynebacterium poyangense]